MFDYLPKKMTFLKFFKEEILFLLKSPKLIDKEENKKIRIAKNTVIEMKPVYIVQKRARRPSEKQRDSKEMNEIKSRPRSHSAPQNIKIEKQHVSSRSRTKTDTRLSKELTRNISNKKTTNQVKKINSRSSTVVQIEI